MASDDEDNGSYHRLTELGLLHLINQPEALAKALNEMAQERQKVEAAWEIEAAKIRAARAAAARGEAAPTPPAKPAPAGLKPTAPLPLTEAPAEPPQKLSIRMVVTRVPGRCDDCRHCNQGTVDYQEGLFFCEIGRAPKQRGQLCDVKRRFPAKPADQDRVPPEQWPEFYYYEPFNGSNGTYNQRYNATLELEGNPPKP